MEVWWLPKNAAQSLAQVHHRDQSLRLPILPDRQRAEPFLAAKTAVANMLGPHWAYGSQRCPCRLQTFWNHIIILAKGLLALEANASSMEQSMACKQVSFAIQYIKTPQAEDSTSSADPLQWHQFDLRSQGSSGCTFCTGLFTRQPLFKGGLQAYRALHCSVVLSVHYANKIAA